GVLAHRDQVEVALFGVGADEEVDVGGAAGGDGKCGTSQPEPDSQTSFELSGKNMSDVMPTEPKYSHTRVMETFPSVICSIGFP
ncbi:hypothetical protein OOZ59_34965, partial [Streptomyces anthocyanicus]|nr:hypothetical protein [Streptomyces anthocyanicus]